MTTRYYSTNQSSSLISSRIINNMIEPGGPLKRPDKTLIVLSRRSSHRKRGILNMKAFCIAIIIGIVISINQSLMSSIMRNTRTRSKVNSNNIISSYNMSLNSINNGLLSDKGSLITLAAAAPGPEPAAVSARVHRVPPMNGSIFGKRSLGSTPKARPESSSQSIGEFGHSTPDRYLDVITDIIEQFMSNNSEGDPKQASMEFCRMIVYKCNQYLHEVDGTNSIYRRRATRKIKN